MHQVFRAWVRAKSQPSTSTWTAWGDARKSRPARAQKVRSRLLFRFHHVAFPVKSDQIKSPPAKDMRTTARHPRVLDSHPLAFFPTILRLLQMSSNTTIIGGATKPLRTAE